MKSEPFSIGELQLMVSSLRFMRGSLETVLADGRNLDGTPVTDTQHNNAVSNIAGCNSAIRKLNQMLRAAEAQTEASPSPHD